MADDLKPEHYTRESRDDLWKKVNETLSEVTKYQGDDVVLKHKDYELKLSPESGVRLKKTWKF